MDTNKGFKLQLMLSTAEKGALGSRRKNMARLRSRMLAHPHPTQTASTYIHSVGTLTCSSAMNSFNEVASRTPAELISRYWWA